MSSVWFIFKEDHHRGPYTTTEVFEMLVKGEATAEDMLWKQGLSKWKQIKEYSEIYDAISPDDKMAPPPVPRSLELERPEFNFTEVTPLDPLLEEQGEIPKLPDIPKGPYWSLEDKGADSGAEEAFLEDELMAVEQKQQKEVHKVQEIEASRLKDFSQEQVDEKEIDQLETIHLDYYQQEEGKKQKSSKKGDDDLSQTSLVNRFFKFFLYCIILSFFIFGSIYFWLHDFGVKEINTQFKGVSQGLESKLWEASKHSLSPFFTKIYPSKNAKIIWLGTSRDGTGMIHLTLTGVEGQVLSKKKVLVRSSAFLENHVAKFEKFSVEEGYGFASGYYKIKAYGYDTSLRRGALEFLKETGYFNFIPEVKYSTREFRYRSQFLLTSKGIKIFKQKLKKYHDNHIGKKKKLYLESIEKITTIKALTQKMLEIFNHHSSKIKKGSDINIIVNHYIKKIAPIVQPLILEAVTKKMSEKNSHYKEIEELGKDLASLMAETSLSYKKYIYPSSKMKRHLAQKFRFSLRKILKKSDKISSEIQTQIAQL